MFGANAMRQGHKQKLLQLDKEASRIAAICTPCRARDGETIKPTDIIIAIMIFIWRKKPTNRSCTFCRETIKQARDIQI